MKEKIELRDGVLSIADENVAILDGAIVETRKLTPIGTGYWLYIPKLWMWIETFGSPFDDSSYRVSYEQEGNQITIQMLMKGQVL
jgi:hypothetical protein